jgi:hypothetical protein
MAPSWDISGIEEKLQRAKENIVNVTTEIDSILGSDRHRVVGDENKHAVEEFIKAHLARPLTPRISVLAAECVHNLRSALDQFAWQLVLAGGGTPTDKTRFPLFLKDPTGDKKATARYDRCVQGMSPAAKARIFALQPFQPDQGGNDHALRILHDLNITDKHHTLLVTKGIARRQHTVTFQSIGVGLHTATAHTEKDGTVAVTFNRPVGAVNVDTEVTIQIAFSQYGSASVGPVSVPDGLNELHASVTRCVSDLSKLR